MRFASSRPRGWAQAKNGTDYTIRATIERDGQLVTKEQTISLKAGDSQDISFDFDNN